jgi:AcrR family transcriptional regulator
MLMADATPARRVAAGGSPARREQNERAASLEQFVGVGHRQIAQIQRARILSAMLDSATERGAGGVSVAHVVERSGVSRRTFYEQFADREDCFFAAFEQALSYASERVVPAYLGEKRWRERIRAGLIALLCFFDQEPQVGRVLITESLAGGPRTLQRRGQVIGKLTSIVEEGASEAKVAFAPSPLTGEGVVGGVLAVIQRRLAEEPHTPLVELTNPLMSMIVLHYLGAGDARRELQRATPAPSSDAIERTQSVDPFKGAGMRLTYRTVRVLIAIAEHPGSSNRVIGETAEIKDQGQISKLLGRLERIGVVQNTPPHQGKGAPNSWALTPSGRQVTESIRAHTEGPSHGARER